MQLRDCCNVIGSASKGGKREKLYTTMTRQGGVKVEKEGESKGEGVGEMGRF